MYTHTDTTRKTLFFQRARLTLALLGTRCTSIARRLRKDSFRFLFLPSFLFGSPRVRRVLNSLIKSSSKKGRTTSSELKLRSMSSRTRQLCGLKSMQLLRLMLNLRYLWSSWSFSSDDDSYHFLSWISCDYSTHQWDSLIHTY